MLNELACGDWNRVLLDQILKTSFKVALMMVVRRKVHRKVHRKRQEVDGRKNAENDRAELQKYINLAVVTEKIL